MIIARTGNEGIACSPSTWFWTWVETESLRELWEGGNLSCRQIARKLGRTRNAVIGRANRIRLSQKQAGGKRPLETWPESWRQHFREMWDDGDPVDQIAKTFDISRRQVFRRRKQMDLTPRETTRRRSRPSKPIPKRVVPQAPDSNPCSILEAENNRCRFPVGDPAKAGFHLCGACTQNRPPYCSYHKNIAYREVRL